MREYVHSGEGTPAWEPPSLLEVYLSYIGADGGRGFDDGTGGEERHLPIQIASFTLALRSAEQILGLEILHSEAMGRAVPTTTWTARFGVRPQQLLKARWLLPNWGQVEALMRRAPGEIDRLVLERLEAGQGGEAWRRWEPAASWREAPLHKVILQAKEPYGHLFPRRISHKSRGDCWEGHRREARESHQRWADSAGYHVTYSGGRVGDYLRQWGARNDGDLNRVLGELRTKLRLIGKLLKHLDTPAARRCHAIDDVSGVRHKCAKCGCWGLLHFKPDWLRRECTMPWVDMDESRRGLKCQEADYLLLSRSCQQLQNL